MGLEYVTRHANMAPHQVDGNYFIRTIIVT